MIIPYKVVNQRLITRYNYLDTVSLFLDRFLIVLKSYHKSKVTFGQDIVDKLRILYVYWYYFYVYW